MDLGAVRQIVAVRIWRGIKHRIQSGQVQQRFLEVHRNDNDPFIANVAAETEGALSQMDRIVTGLLQPGMSLESKIGEFEYSYRTLLPQGKMEGHVDAAVKEMGEKIIDYARAIQRLLMASPDIQTHTIDTNGFANLFLSIFFEQTSGMGPVEAPELLEAFLTKLPDQLIGSGLVLEEDATNILLLLNNAKIKEDNLFDWLGKWWTKSSVFQATPEQRENLRLNMLSEIFYGEEEE
ncbi:MAG: hypothetical protein HQ564_05690 [Candidatus Saganbacteria bacterium]|nr:hypothetical protein [Candidatus Saganbacteria bacterium]